MRTPTAHLVLNFQPPRSKTLGGDSIFVRRVLRSRYSLTGEERSNKTQYEQQHANAENCIALRIESFVIVS